MEVLHCEECGTRIYDGYTDDFGDLYCCENCLPAYMNKTYGEGMWRSTEHPGVNGGFFEFFDETSGEWYDTGIYYTTFQ